MRQPKSKIAELTEAYQKEAMAKLLEEAKSKTSRWSGEGRIKSDSSVPFIWNVILLKNGCHQKSHTLEVSGIFFSQMSTRQSDRKLLSTSPTIGWQLSEHSHRRSFLQRLSQESSAHWFPLIISRQT